MRRLFSVLLVMLMLVQCLPLTASAVKKHPFVDVPEGAYYEDAVIWAVENSITSGTSKTTFSPNMVCDRAQAVTFLWRAKGSPEPASTELGFSDVKASDYYFKAVAWAVENNITAGTGGGKFSPTMKCDRSQIVTFLWRAMGCPASEGAAPFADVSADAYYRSAVIWAVENGITSGTGGGYFSPLMKCDRSQIVTFLYRCFKKTTSELGIIVQPEDYYMRGSQEEVTFSITIEGGQPNYYYEWVVLYENGAHTTLHGATPDTEDEFTVEITDYDFDGRNSIKELIVYCTVTDIEGTEITSDRVSIYAKEHYPHLTIVNGPADYYMGSSQEEASFTVEVDGGFAPYSYNWVVLCDGEVKDSIFDLTDEKTNTFKYVFSDYDFDDYRDISVYCIVQDQHANSNCETVTSKHAAVWSKETFRIVSQPQDHRMSSSHEVAEFAVMVWGGVAPYTYTWCVAYDNLEVPQTPMVTTNKSSTFTHSFSDYDFDDYNNVGVYCVITDARGTKLETKMGNVIPK